MHPELFHWGFLHVRTYGLMLAVAFLVGTWIALTEARAQRIDEDRLVNVILVALSGYGREEDKRQALENALADVLGVAVHVSIVVTGEVAARHHEVDELLAQDDVLAFGVNELGGEITDPDE